MIEHLTALYNALLTIKTEGEDTLKMAGCINYTKQLIDALNSASEQENLIESEEE